MNKVSALLGDTLLYGLGNIVPRLLNFLLFPLHTRFFSPEDYGAVSYLYIIAAFLNVICSFGMETAYFRHTHKGPYSEQQIFNITQTIIMGISLTVAVLLCCFANTLAAQISLSGKTYYIFWLAAIIFIDAIVVIPFARLRLRKKPLVFALARIINVLILVGLNVFFFVGVPRLTAGTTLFDVYQHTLGVVLGGKNGISYVFLANLIANGFYLLFFIKTFIQWRPFWNKAIFFSMIGYAYPIMITGVAGILNEMFSRWALKWWLPHDFYPGKNSLYAVGLLSVAYKYAIAMSLAIQAFRLAAEPFFFANAQQKNSPKLFAHINHLFVIVMSFLFLAIVVNLDVLKFIAGNEVYYKGLAAVPMLLCSYLFLGMYYNISIWFKLVDKTYYGTLITLGGITVTIVGNLILIPLWGYVGSSWASLACYFFMAGACYITGQKNFPIPYTILSSLGYVLFAAALALFSYKIVFLNQWYATAFHLFIVVAYAVVAYVIERKRGFFVA